MVWKSVPDDTKTVFIKAKVTVVTVKKATLTLRSSLTTDVEIGRAVTLYADAKNVGNVVSNYRVDFDVNGVKTSKTLTGVAVAASKRATHTFSMPAASVTVKATVTSEA